MKAILSRRNDPDQTPGVLVVLDKGEVIFTCRTLELKNLGNMPNISRIPEGKYKVEKIIRPDGRSGLWVKGVPSRSSILIHSGNYAAGTNVDIEGCILVGSKYKDLNKDGHLDIIESVKTFTKLFKVLDSSFELIIFS